MPDSMIPPCWIRFRISMVPSPAAPTRAELLRAADVRRGSRLRQRSDRTALWPRPRRLPLAAPGGAICCVDQPRRPLRCEQSTPLEPSGSHRSASLTNALDQLFDRSGGPARDLLALESVPSFSNVRRLPAPTALSAVRPGKLLSGLQVIALSAVPANTASTDCIRPLLTSKDMRAEQPSLGGLPPSSSGASFSNRGSLERRAHQAEGVLRRSA